MIIFFNQELLVWFWLGLSRF